MLKVFVNGALSSVARCFSPRLVRYPQLTIGTAAEARSYTTMKSTRNSGFAIVIALSLMAFVLLLLLSITTLVQVESQSAQTHKHRLEAEQAALLSLNIAIGKLQEVAGPDQRVTAAAAILGDANNAHVSTNPDGSSATGASVSPVAGQSSWTGVWKSDTVSTDTASYSPKAPNERELVGWLVSSANDTTGQFELPTTLDDVATDVNTNDPSDLVVLSTRATADANGNKTYVQVEKVRVDATDGGTTAFAFAVEDESLKADLSWNELAPSNLSAERYQASRLTAAPGPDYGALNGSGATGPFDTITYPLSSDSTTLIADGILKLSDVESITSTMTNGVDAAAWLQDAQANVTWGSRGVMADVKLGGLRRDLSLAFEMDGEADVSATSFPTLFSAQDGEFVGGSDRLASPQLAKGMRGVYERFLYRDTSSSGSLFSSDIANSYVSPHWASVRGPTWWALRDYANLYKRLEGSSGNYTMNARAHYPNLSVRNIDSSFDLNHTLGELCRTEKTLVDRSNSGRNAWNCEMSMDLRYIYRPARSNYAPVLLGSVCYYSLKNNAGFLELIADPVFYLWNPYNRTIKADTFAVCMEKGFSGTLKFEVKAADGSTKNTYGPRNFSAYVGSSGASYNITYLLSNLTLAPGEVVSASPPPGDTNKNSGLVIGGGPTNTSGLTIRRFPIGNNKSPSFETVPLAPGDTVTATLGVGSAYFAWSNRTHTGLPPSGVTAANQLSNRNNWGDQIQAIDFWVPLLPSTLSYDSYYDIELAPDGVTFSDSELSLKSPFGATAYLALPADSTMPVEILTQFNPASLGGNERSFNRRCDPNYTFRARCMDGGFNTLIDEMGFDFPPNIRNAYWGTSFEDYGSTHLPTNDIPSSPLFSMAQFSHAALTTKTSEAFHAVGNSWASVLIEPVSPYGKLEDGDNAGEVTAADASWLLNDALFDRYYLSGIAPDYSISSTGYSATGTLRDTLTKFFSADYRSANANPVLRPYLPEGTTVAEVIDQLDDTTNGKGYLKMGAYSLIDGQFNVNSTSVEAWAALLRANRNLDVDYAGSGSDTTNGVPFPAGPTPAFDSGAGNYWSGLSRLDDGQIQDLAEAIVDQVKLRGPFMSLSDFVNHRVGGSSATDVHYMGALQAAIEASGINSSVQSGAGGVEPDYTSSIFAEYFPDPLPNGDRKTTTGIPGDITQANLLLPLAPRLSARSDTFRVRAYGERRSLDGGTILSKAICEAVLQRVPEYVDPDTDAANNEPWDQELANPLSYTATASASSLNALNSQFGRRFKIVSFRWLSPEELN
ncbi:hypothetical protein SH580_06115 [Coraliomargarita algicola]|uniref:Tfp pilus assembly protein PilX n=1 Tax=Coraliomargarita algicola TaxID=3092156 RepID=A0ABZ0RQ83_9BACT|nr:hypothetical protein [Coraliomargarita sp. J2-16]WPJ97281.1 hypothetical protein SH580_06115 [Coraliomargarita sp. J2-16]